jgi:hypothetical protein
VRSQVTLVAGLLTGHCYLKWYLLDRLERVLLFDRLLLLDRTVLIDRTLLFDTVTWQDTLTWHNIRQAELLDKALLLDRMLTWHCYLIGHCYFTGYLLDMTPVTWYMKTRLTYVTTVKDVRNKRNYLHTYCVTMRPWLRRDIATR